MQIKIIFSSPMYMLSIAKRAWLMAVIHCGGTESWVRILHYYTGRYKKVTLGTVNLAAWNP